MSELVIAEIGRALRHARRARGLTQAEAARRAGVSCRLWVETERGTRHHLSVTTLLRMGSTVGLPLFQQAPAVPEQPVAPAPPAAPAAPAAGPPAPSTVRSGDRIPTGTGADRRRLTREEAEAGGLPERMTRAEWQAMTDASRAYHNRLMAEGVRTWRQQLLNAKAPRPQAWDHLRASA